VSNAVQREGSMPIDLEQARAFLRQKEERRQAGIEVRFQQAWRDFQAIVTLIAERYRPARIYQWGSLLHRPRFCEWSDIDVAIEGLGSAERRRRTEADGARVIACWV
jgi:hypothetical protein